MFTLKNYVAVKDLEEAYGLNQDRNNVVLGGMTWLKMSRRNYKTAIDLSKLGLDKIIETDDAFEIGCMTTLRDAETHPGLDSFFGGVISESIRHIVGVQFRNCATIGGSVFGRFGFSDILTCFLSLDSYVELYKGGRIPLSDFAGMKRDRDILVKIILKKDGRRIAYMSHRNTATDFPVVACAVARTEGGWLAVLGARPGRARLLRDDDGILSNNPSDDEISRFISYMGKHTDFGSNMRGGEEYRRHLAGVLIRRAIRKITERGE